MDPSKRVRASTPRTRSGCLNCRTRRIKCDEKRPACERCVRSGWICPGYNQSGPSVQSNASSSALVPSAVASPPALSITHYSLPFKVPGSQEERRALHYFANFAAADVSGYLPSEFWSRTILQRCQHDVPVRHAAAALGRAHMEYITAADTSSFNVTEETAAAYGRAIKAVRNYLGRNGDHDKSMVLICSAIFYCFELMRSERRGALQHLESGTQILRTWQAEQSVSSSSMAESKEELMATFVRMELQATYYDDGRLPTLRTQGGDSSEMSPTAFESLTDAQDSLFALIHSASVYLVQNTPYKFADARLIPAHVSSMRRRLVHQYDHWAKRLSLLLSDLRDTMSDTTLDEARHRTVLAVFKLHWQTTRLLLLHSLQDATKESAPSFDDVADEHLRLAKDVVDTPVQSERQPSPGHGNLQAGERSFSLHLGIITPMLLLAFKTQHSHIREMAVELLQAAKGRREGFHDAEITANLITELGTTTADLAISRPDSSGSPPALEWYVDSALRVNCWQDHKQRLDGWERLWTAVA